MNVFIVDDTVKCVSYSASTIKLYSDRDYGDNFDNTIYMSVSW